MLLCSGCSVSVCGGSEPVLLFALVVGWFGALFHGAFFRFALVYEWWWWCVGAGVFFGAVLCSWFAF
ncbi:hypothetical protein P8452_62751 [Trifolium repens]|nr:hypothetical protein P8452_62751 [Trifolium repens]